jgi:Na+/glutamate symporter
MNNWFKSTLGISGAGLIALIALYGKGFLDAVQAAFLFLFNLAQDAPLGVGSFALALALAVVAQAFVSRFAATLPCPKSREFCTASLGLLIGTGVMWLQLHNLDGLLLGLLAGFSSPFVYLSIAAVVSLLARTLRKADAE